MKILAVILVTLILLVILVLMILNTIMENEPKSKKTLGELYDREREIEDGDVWQTQDPP